MCAEIDKTKNLRLLAHVRRMLDAGKVPPDAVIIAVREWVVSDAIASGERDEDRRNDPVLKNTFGRF